MFQETKAMIHRSQLPSYLPTIDNDNARTINHLIANHNLKSTTGYYGTTPLKAMETPQPTMTLAPGTVVYTNTPFGHQYDSRFSSTTPHHHGPITSPSKHNKSNSRDKYLAAGMNRQIDESKLLQGDRSNLSEDEENDLMARFNRDKNMRSEFYESLKENHQRQSYDKLPEIKNILDSTKVSVSNLYSPAKQDTLKMRKIRAKRGRSEARRAKLAIMESPEGSGTRIQEQPMKYQQPTPVMPYVYNQQPEASEAQSMVQQTPYKREGRSIRKLH